MPIRATSLKLPSKLKDRIDRLAKQGGETPHALMVRAIELQIAAMELHEQFVRDAMAARKEMQETGLAYDAKDVHAYLRAKVRGRKVRRAQAGSMARLKYSARALEDLDRLVAFLEEASPGAVASSLDEILRAHDVVTEHPQVGRRVGATPLRELVISHGATGCLALYEFDAARGLVYVHRIRHQREAGYLD